MPHNCGVISCNCDFISQNVTISCNVIIQLWLFIVTVSQFWLFSHNCEFLAQCDNTVSHCISHCISQLYDLIQWLNDFFLTIGLYLAVANQSLVFTIWPFDLTIVNLCLVIVTIYISHNVTLFLIFNVSHKYCCIFTQRWKQTSIRLQWAEIVSHSEEWGEKLLNIMWVREGCLCSSDHYTQNRNKRDSVMMYNGFSSFLCETVVSNNEG